MRSKNPTIKFVSLNFLETLIPAGHSFQPEIDGNDSVMIGISTTSNEEMDLADDLEFDMEYCDDSAGPKVTVNRFMLDIMNDIGVDLDDSITSSDQYLRMRYPQYFTPSISSAVSVAQPTIVKADSIKGIAPVIKQPAIEELCVDVEKQEVNITLTTGLFSKVFHPRNYQKRMTTRQDHIKNDRRKRRFNRQFEKQFDLESAAAQSEKPLYLEARLRGGYLREPKVSVEVEAFRPFFVLGEVGSSGQYPFVNGMTAQTAIAIAGGFSPRGDQSGVDVTRVVNGRSMTASVPLTFPIRPGDTITIRERFF